MNSLQEKISTTNSKTFRKILSPTFKISNPYDIQLANKRNIHFKRTRITENFKQDSYQKLLKRNLKFLNRSEFCKFSSRKSLYFLQKLNQQELNPHFTKAADLIYLLRFLSREKISIRYLKLFSHFANNQRYQRKYFKHLYKTTTSLRIEQNSPLEWQSQDETAPLLPARGYPEVHIDQIYKGISFFENIKKLSLDFLNSRSRNAYSQSFLCELLKMTSQIPSLKALEIRMTIAEIEKKTQKMKPFTEGFTQLKSLKLDFIFFRSLIETGKIFTTLLPLPATLRHLSINLLKLRMSLNCSDLADFIGSLKNLETFKFTCQHLLFDEYIKVFQAIQKLKSLKKLSVVQHYPHDDSFAFGLVFKTLNVLNKLTSIKIDLGSKLDDIELNAYPGHLLKHPTLKEAKIVFQVSPIHGCRLKEDFYVGLQRLRDKLTKFKLILRSFPVEAREEIKKIVVRKKTDLRNFDCQAVELNDQYIRRVIYLTQNGGDAMDGDD